MKALLKIDPIMLGSLMIHSISALPDLQSPVYLQIIFLYYRGINLAGTTSFFNRYYQRQYRGIA